METARFAQVKPAGKIELLRGSFMKSNLRKFLFTILIYVAFFASGASSLIAEVTWNRMLIVFVGNSLSAAAMIISIFMGGLGLGSYFGGKFFAGRRRSLLPYLALEMVIGLYVILSPALLDGLTRIFIGLAESVDNGVVLAGIRILTVMAALLVPAFLMGATFPAIVSGTAIGTSSGKTARTGYLYSINTLGAAIGCFAAGYHLLLEFGVQVTLNIAFGMYMVAALSALLANFLNKPGTEEAEADLPAGKPIPLGLKRFLMVATFAIGFVSLAYEVLLTRLSILYLGNSVSVFPLVLTAFLLGTGISAIAGTWLFGLLHRAGRKAGKLFGVLAVAAGAFIILTPYLLLTDLVLTLDHMARLAESTIRNPLPILGLLILPTILIGGLLPIAIRMLNPNHRGENTRGASTLYSLNTAGGLVGAGIANHYLVPMMGIQGTLALLVAVCLAVGLFNLLNSAGSAKRYATTGLLVGMAVIVMVAVLPPMMDLYANKLARSTQADTADVLLVREGRAATVTVIDQNDPRLGTYRDMYLNGVEEASTRYWHVQLFKLLGILPVMAHQSDGPKDVMVIAFGAGITAGSVLASDEVASLDVADLNPDIEGINDLFTEVNGDVFHQPRFHFHNDDGRNFLVTNNKKYDLIIGDSTHPRAYDSWILYTEEFYETVKKRLAPDGIFAQWVPVLGSMRGELFRIHLNTFRKVFPNATFWYVYGSDQAFFMATPEPLLLDSDRLQAKLDKLPEWFRAEEFQLDTVARVAGFFWMDSHALDVMIQDEQRFNTDGVHYFDKQSATYPFFPQWQLPRFQANALPYFHPANPVLAQAIAEEQVVAGHLAEYAFFNQTSDLTKAYCAMPENGTARYFMSLEFEGVLPDPEIFCRSEVTRTYEEILALHPENFQALNALAEAYAEEGRLPEALVLANKALDLAPDNGMVLDTLGWILFKMGKSSEALVTLREALEALPDHPIVLYHLGVVYLEAGNEELGRDHLAQALSASPVFPGADDARARLK